jgi:small-conductance mechanosensitive channel
MGFQPQQLLAYAHTAASILVIIIVGYVIYVLLRRVLGVLAQRDDVPQPLMQFLRVFLRWGVLVIIVLLCLQQVGVRIAVLWASLLSLMALIAVGFIAAWSVLSNILCSILLIVFDLFRLGDEIEIIEATGGKGLRGTVVDLNILYTSIQETHDEEASDAITHVPNNLFFQKTTRRWRGKNTRRLELSLLHSSPLSSETPPDPPETV